MQDERWTRTKGSKAVRVMNIGKRVRTGRCESACLKKRRSIVSQSTRKLAGRGRARWGATACRTPCPLRRKLHLTQASSLLTLSRIPALNKHGDICSGRPRLPTGLEQSDGQVLSKQVCPQRGPKHDCPSTNGLPDIVALRQQPHTVLCMQSTFLSAVYPVPIAHRMVVVSGSTV